MQPENKNITSQKNSSLYEECRKFFSSPLSTNDLSYSEFIIKNKNLKFLCEPIEIPKPEEKNDVIKLFNNHDFKCEYILLKYLTESEMHKQKLIKFPNPQMNKLNRYSNIIPFTYNCVTISPSSPQSPQNYINASYITGSLGTKIISAQSPLENTVNSFWLMIINHKISLIIFLSYSFEESNNKFFQYWPKDTSIPLIIDGGSNGKYEVRMKLVFDVITKYEMKREFEITKVDNRKSKITVEQFHVNCWEEHSIPLQETGVKVLDDLIFQIEDNTQKENNHVLIHCNDGIGRSGTFIALVNIIKCLIAQRRQKIEKPVYNVFNVVRKLREERYGMVTDPIQYKYIYDFINEWIRNFYEI